MKKPLEDWRRAERGLQKKFGKTLFGPFTAAIGRYALIQSGDRIAVNVDGTAKSLALAKLLELLSRFSRTPFSAIVTCSRGEEAARMLRLPVQSSARGATKRALPDTFDDSIETTLMSMMYEGSLRGLRPKEKTADGEVIRPLILTRLSDTEAWARWCGLPIAEKNSNDVTRMLFDALGRKDAEMEKSIFMSTYAVCAETFPRPTAIDLSTEEGGDELWHYFT